MAETKTDRQRGNLHPLANLYPYLKRYKWQVLGALFFLLLAAATTLTLPIAVRNMIDHGFIGNNAEFIGNYFSALIGVAGLLAFSSTARYWFVIWLGERVIADLRKDVFAHIAGLSADFFDRSQSGEIVSRLSADTVQIKSAVGATASMALRNTILAIGAVGAMIYTSPRLSAIVLVIIPLVVVPLIGFGRAVRKRSRQAQDRLAEATSYASESISAVQMVQAFTVTGTITKRFSNAVEQAFIGAKRAVTTRALLTGFAIFLIFSGVIAILWVGASDVLSGTMSPGLLSQFLLYAVFAAGAFGSLSEVWGEISQASGAAERIGELLAEKPAIAAPKNPKSLPKRTAGNLALDKIHFAYPARPETGAITNVSAKIKAGETIAIVGPSGAGKSTLISLILRFYDPQKGKIALEGINIAELDPDALRTKIALVPQDTVIFAASAHDNIALGRPDARREEIIEAAKAANAHEFIVKLPKGYDEPLGERGTTLSGGQRQRIAIARAILKDAPILLLDEATSALDAGSEKLVQDALEKLMQSRTTIVIAHRLATILKADRILVMDEGRLVEQGTHKTLSKKKNGLYANLAKLQFHG